MNHIVILWYVLPLPPLFAPSLTLALPLLNFTLTLSISLSLANVFLRLRTISKKTWTMPWIYSEESPRKSVSTKFSIKRCCKNVTHKNINTKNYWSNYKLYWRSQLLFLFVSFPPPPPCPSLIQFSLIPLRHTIPTRVFFFSFFCLRFVFVLSSFLTSI
jgi:hypothetical protein